MNKDVLEVLGKDGVIINVGRGVSVDEAELVVALKEGKIARVILDVFEHEPKMTAELFSMDNVVLLARAAVFMDESRSDLSANTIGYLEAFFFGLKSMMIARMFLGWMKAVIVHKEDGDAYWHKFYACRAAIIADTLSQVLQRTADAVVYPCSYGSVCQSLLMPRLNDK